MDAAFLKASYSNPLFNAWKNMKRRCRTEASYLRKGITVAPEWLDWKTFAKDMHPRPPGLTLERKDNSKGYSRDNCSWATQREQQNNRENNRRVTIGCTTLTVADWVRRLGLSNSLVRSRLAGGWDAEKAFLAPAKEREEKREEHAHHHIP